MKNISNLEIKKGINLHMIKTNKFKTNLLAVFLTTPLQKEKVTFNGLIPAVLRRGSKSMPSQEEISISLEEMYGASFDCGIDKIGDDQVLKFYLETINNEFLPEQEDNLEKAIKILLEVVFNPLVNNNEFNKEYVESEKNNLKQIIEGRKDSKATYAYERCIEEMYKNMPYSLYKYGNIEDLENIDEKNLYQQYKKLINNCKIDIFVSGNIEEDIKEKIFSNEDIQRLQDRDAVYIINNKENRLKEEKQEQEVSESMDLNQGKLIIGLDILQEKDLDKYTALIYNAILGGIPTSKMFQNVREKASLAYTARSNYVRQKNNIYIRCGIEIENYEKALNIIKEQLEDMKQGNFTDEDLENAKKYMVSGIKSVQDEQDSEITYYIGQELSGKLTTFEEYIEEINKVRVEDVKNVANKININTIYFLRN